MRNAAIAFHGGLSGTKRKLSTNYISWVILFAVNCPRHLYKPILPVKCNEFLIAVMGVCRVNRSSTCTVSGGYLADKRGRRGVIVTMTFRLAMRSLFSFLPHRGSLS
jgi:hypothetical protein